MQMVDIHCHILPGLDDGAETIYDTLDMAQLAYRSGTTHIVATPHCNIPGVFDNYFDESYRKSFDLAKRAIENEGIPITLMQGMEVYATAGIYSLAEGKKLTGINNTKNLLIEFNFGEDPDFVNSVLLDVQRAGMTPVIAHAERYAFVQENPDTVFQWHTMGCFVQANKGSFLGRFGKSAERTAYELLNHNLITAVASDAHSPAFRTTCMADAYDFLCGYYSEEYISDLFCTNPYRLCCGEPPVQYRKIPFDEQI